MPDELKKSETDGPFLKDLPPAAEPDDTKKDGKKGDDEKEYKAERDGEAYNGLLAASLASAGNGINGGRPDQVAERAIALADAVSIALQKLKEHEAKQADEGKDNGEKTDAEVLAHGKVDSGPAATNANTLEEKKEQLDAKSSPEKTLEATHGKDAVGTPDDKADAEKRPL